MVGIHRAGTAAHAVYSIGAVGAAAPAAARETGGEWVVVAEGDIEFCVEVGVAGDGDDDVSCFAIAEPRIAGKGQDTFLIDGDYGRRNHEIRPQDLPFAFAFGGQNLSVGLGKSHDERRLLSGGDGGAIGETGFHGCDGSFGQVDPHP